MLFPHSFTQVVLIGNLLLDIRNLLIDNRHGFVGIHNGTIGCPVFAFDLDQSIPKLVLQIQMICAIPIPIQRTQQAILVNNYLFCHRTLEFLYPAALASHLN